jgi:glycosyltransferase involved in cell wall biosynthesis
MTSALPEPSPGAHAAQDVPPAAPEASIIIPAYRSEQTIGRCLTTMLDQVGLPSEIIVIDSSPDDGTEQTVRSGFPSVHYWRSRQRLLPHAARNQGARLARSDLLVFTDPDIYAPGGWLTRLTSSQRRLGGVVVGALRCHGREWLPTGMHMAKFDSWLPGGAERTIDIAPTANLVCPRATLEAAGEFPEDSMLGDTLLSWRLQRMGVPIWFDPQAVVEHHHLGGARSLLSERLSRGREFAVLRMRQQGWTRNRRALQLLLTITPIRLARLILRGVRNAARAGLLPDYLWSGPIVMAGQAAWLAGEVQGYLEGPDRLVRG